MKAKHTVRLLDADGNCGDCDCIVGRAECATCGATGLWIRPWKPGRRARPMVVIQHKQIGTEVQLAGMPSLVGS